MRHKTSLLALAVFVLSCVPAFADCPSADLTGDGFVDFEDFSVMANQWLTSVPDIGDNMTFILGGEFEMGDHFAEGSADELPVHTVLLDRFFISTCEITNQQYCDYLNSAFDAGDIKVDDGIVYAYSDSINGRPYSDTHDYDPDSQIDYNDISGTFSVRTKGSPPRDMSDDPMVRVSWYGSVAYCNWRSSEEGYDICYDLSTWNCNFSKQGYRLPTEAEWEYAARGGLSDKRFPWGNFISHSQSNYEADPCNYSYDVSLTEGFHPDWDDGIYPYTSPCGSFSTNGYGLYDMTGNVWEWCNDRYDSAYYDTSPYDNPTGPSSGSYRVLHGGCWSSKANYCRVATRFHDVPVDRSYCIGFRVVLDLD